MDPVSLSLGAVVAALVVKAAEGVGDRAAEGAAGGLGRLVGWLRGRLSGSESDVLARVEEVPDSPSRAKELAAAIDRLAAADSQFRGELQALVEQARKAGVDVESVSQSVWGNQNVQVAGVSDSEIRVNYGQPPSPTGG